MKRRLLLSFTAASAAGLLASCASQNLADYAAEKPVLDLRQYFNGTLDAYGVFTDRSGAVVKRFTVVMNCSWTGDEGVLDEDFSYSDGTSSADGVEQPGEVGLIGMRISAGLRDMAGALCSVHRMRPQHQAIRGFRQARGAVEPVGGRTQIMEKGESGLSDEASRLSRVAIAHPEGFPLAVANIYVDLAAAIRDRASSPARRGS